MSTTSDTRQKRTADALAPRTRRALEEKMTVLPDAEGLYTVTTESGREYTVDAREARCTCPDHRHREVHCKHLRRVAFATGAKPIPKNVPVDPLLGEHVAAGPDRREIAARELGYESYADAPATVRRQIEHSTDDGLTVVEDAWSEIADRLADLAEA